MFTMFYKNFDAVVNSYEEACELLINRYGYYDPDELFLEEN